MRKIVNTLLAGAVSIFAASCVSDIEPGGDVGDNVDIVLSLNTPGGFSSKRTRSLTYARENTIGSIHLLVFDGATDVLTAVKSGADIVELEDNKMTAPAGGISGSGSFKVTLPPSTGLDEM